MSFLGRHVMFSKGALYKGTEERMKGQAIGQLVFCSCLIERDISNSSSGRPTFFLGWTLLYRQTSRCPESFPMSSRVSPQRDLLAPPILQSIWKNYTKPPTRKVHRPSVACLLTKGEAGNQKLMNMQSMFIMHLCLPIQVVIIAHLCVCMCACLCTHKDIHKMSHLFRW